MTSTCMVGPSNLQDNRVYNIRVATEEDIDTIMAMGEKFYNTTEIAGQIPFDEDSGAVQVFTMLECGFILLAEKGEEVVGMLGMILQDFPFNRAYKVCTEQMFWIEEEHRGTLLASTLMKHAEAIAVYENVSTIVMAALETSPESIEKFYSHMGYRRSDRTFIKGV